MADYSANERIYGGLAITNHNVVSEQNGTGYLLKPMDFRFIITHLKLYIQILVVIPIII